MITVTYMLADGQTFSRTFTDGGATAFSLRILQAGGFIVGVSEAA